MTDKQIIIHGVDIGWCKNYNEANSKDCETLYICAENPNCYYKQLKRKEQECEELKDKLNCCFCNPYVELNDIEKQRKCVEVTECFRRQLDQLRAENQGFKILHKSDKGLITSIGKQNYQLIQEYDKVKTENDRLINELDRLNEDRIEALKQLEFIRTLNTVQETEIRKYSKTLTEIKEIAEHCITQDICTFCDNSDKCYIEDEEIPTYDVCKLILQKISKCEVK